VLARVAGLRSRRAYEEAVQVLGAALREAPNDSTRERLGFELGSLLTHQLHDTARACAFWSAFRLEHVNGRYDAEVRATVESLGCAGGK
jgi:transmembrane sensor